MLKQMQAKYAEKPVRFLLVPCNQFGAQEPAPNADIKAFAEQSVTLAKNGPGSKVVMLAKSNLNGVKCESTGADMCTSSSDVCCPANDVVYDYLLSVTKPGTIVWNFDKIIVGKDGRPFAGEAIMHGGDVEHTLDPIIDRLLAARSDGLAEVPVARRSNHSFLVAVVACCALALAMVMRRPGKGSRVEEERYVYLAA